MQSHTVLFGGTFDPVHNAHVEIARAARARFGLRRVLFVPAANPPHKSRGAQASYEDRVRMLQLASRNEPGFEVSRIEQSSAASPARPSYSIDTIEKVRAAGTEALSFLIGADAFAEITTWYRWQDVVSLVEFIVVTRPGALYEIPPGATVHELGGLRMPVSSSEIRQRLAAGDGDVPVPEPVLRYIREHGLYR
ncbi:MAG: nicotinate (nicotinamide) nucleotide adenylyltransferase [Acidobacteriota bacterium]